MFAALQGVSAPPPFGGNLRTIVIKADPERVRSYHLTPDEIAVAIARNNVILPAGIIRTNDKAVITATNSVVDNFKELENVTVKTVARSEEHTSELQSLMRISYAVFCLK